MRLSTRKVLDRAFSGTGLFAIALMACALVAVLAPILVRGAGAYVFRGTIEHRRFLLERFNRGDRAAFESEQEEVRAARAPVYDLLDAFRRELDAAPAAERRRYRAPLKALEEELRDLLGPHPGDPPALLMRNQYGETRWDRALHTRERVLYAVVWDYSDPTQLGRKRRVPRRTAFEGTALEPLFAYVERHTEDLLRPRWTCYARFLADPSFDAHFFGGIGPETLGTLYLTLGAMLFAMPMGVIAAIYLAEYAKESRLIGLLRTCISTLAGVPSIVFGLFGLAFFINTVGVSDSKSVLAGALTLALMILPTVIRTAEEAIRAVPRTYKEAALSLGAGTWHTVTSVILPAAMPGILTGLVISMGRAAGETAPIIFTAAVSVGSALTLRQVFSQPTPALPWNIYNVSTEHEAVDEIRHVQYGMVATLIVMVLLLNLAALLMRARINRRLRG